MAGLEGQHLDRYELRQFLGRGGMADVYRGYDPHFERDVAIKVFKRDEEALLTRFIREARLMASLRHVNLLPVYDTGECIVDSVKRNYMVMPLMEGGTLRDRIRQGPLSLKEACSYLLAIGSALDYIHAQGIIHRDIKSSNVLLDSEGHCYLADFGIARITMSDSLPLTTVGNVLGTVDYIAPELFEANHRADARSDLYALGVLTFEMITGHLPFASENQLAVLTMQITRPAPPPSGLVHTIPPQVDRVVLRALEKKPELRYSSAGEFADAFCQAIGTGGSYSGAGWTQNDEMPTQLAKPTPRLNLSPLPSSSPGPLRTMPMPSPMPLFVPESPQAPVYQPPVMSRPPAPPGSNRGRIIAVLALLTLLVVLAPIAFVLVRSRSNLSPTPIPGVIQTIAINPTSSLAVITTSPLATTQLTTTPGATPTVDITATAQSATATAQDATATQQANDTATATAATATVQAQATATAGVIQTATSGPATYKDSLTNPANPPTAAAQWDQNTSTCVFKPDGYHVTEPSGVLTPSPIAGCHEAGSQYSNMAISVDVTILSGATGGLFFRMASQTLGAYAGYLFEVDSKGNYRLTSSSNFTISAGNTILRDWTSSAALKTGNGVKNTLQILAKNGDLSLYVNGVFLGPSVQDSSYTTGNIGFLATTVKGGAGADIVYSNLNVYTLS